MKPQVFGSIEVHKLVEIERLAMDATWLLPNITPEHLDKHREWLAPWHMEPGTDKVYLSFHSYVIRTPTLNILVDTCNGNHKERPSMPAWHRLETPYLERLKALGLAPENIDIVMCTHLHADHVGWNTRLDNGRWVPTFPKARYIFSRADFAHFDAMHRAGEAVNRGSFVDSVLPIVEHGQAVMVDPGDVVDADLSDNVWLEGAPGHSPGNVNIFLKSGGRRGCFCGDVLHHAIQCAAPELSNFADFDSAQGKATRAKLIDRCADSDILMLTGHFPDPTAGRIVSRAGGLRFQFADEG
jgi:glyoxylase-like metal-dependent hydrolase (beta-lactamase superfamily II)